MGSLHYQAHTDTGIMRVVHIIIPICIIGIITDLQLGQMETQT